MGNGPQKRTGSRILSFFIERPRLAFWICFSTLLVSTTFVLAASLTFGPDLPDMLANKIRGAVGLIIVASLI